MAEGQKYNLKGQDGIRVWTNLPEGTKITLINGAVGEIIANPHDGGWVQVKFLEHPQASMVGAEEFVFFNEVQEAVG
jgi:hypothetical protein